MSEQDIMQRIICPSLNLRAYTVLTLTTTQEITRLHQTTPNATSALGKAINIAALLGATLKPDSNQNITFRVQGSGPLNEVHVQCDARGHIRGYVGNPQIDLNTDVDSVDFSKVIGAGLITVTRNLGMKTPYTGVSPMIHGDLAFDTAFYLTNSEQVPSAIITALNLDTNGEVITSGGILIQTFPDTPESSIKLVDNNIQKNKRSLSKALKSGDSIITYLSDIMSNRDLQILSTTEIHHKCRCSKEVLKNALVNSHEDDLKVMIDEDHGAEILCTFCNRKYHFSEEELSEIIMAKKAE